VHPAREKSLAALPRRALPALCAVSHWDRYS
jgi:hypothetical protein